MKFYGEANLLVKERKRKPFSTKKMLKPIFRFDENGEYITNDEKLINKLKTKFKFENENFKCKKCDYEIDNKGLLLAHYRKEHPKNKEVK